MHVNIVEKPSILLLGVTCMKKKSHWNMGNFIQSSDFNKHDIVNSKDKPYACKGVEKASVALVILTDMKCCSCLFSFTLVGSLMLVTFTISSWHKSNKNIHTGEKPSVCKHLKNCFFVLVILSSIKDLTLLRNLIILSSVGKPSPLTVPVTPHARIYI